MQPLITRNEIAQYRQISKTPNDAKLNEMILDAQLLDLQPLLGDNFLNKIEGTPEDYTDLLEGSLYDYKGISYTNHGLKMVLSYFTYARYLMFSTVTDTPFSVVEKLNDNSKQVDYSTKKSIYAINRDSAFTIWKNVELYLLRTDNQDYKNYKCPNPKQGGFRLTKIT